MFLEREVTGERCSAVEGAFVVAVGVLGLLAEAPPVLAARALDAPLRAIIRLQMAALRQRNRKTTSFVGLRG
jgi:hypothetical protein